MFHVEGLFTGLLLLNSLFFSFPPTHSLQDDRDAFFICDLGDVIKKHLRWTRNLPRVTPFYAVKCNDSRPVVETLASLGIGFDCASKVNLGTFHCTIQSDLITKPLYGQLKFH